MSESKPVSRPMDVNVKLTKQENEITSEEKNLPYTKLMGALMYLAVATRPDIAHAVSALEQLNLCYGQTHWTAAKRVLRYLKGTMDLGLIFQRSGKKLTGYIDADWASCLVDRRSYTGYVFQLSNGTIS